MRNHRGGLLLPYRAWPAYGVAPSLSLLPVLPWLLPFQLLSSSDLVLKSSRHSMYSSRSHQPTPYKLVVCGLVTHTVFSAALDGECSCNLAAADSL